MKVVLFCGGLGMRIRTDNQSLPKPMMPIGTRPVLWHVMRYYAHFGHKDFILCLGYGAQAVKDYFLNYRETTSNDFVLMQGGEDVKMLSTDISEWTISFIDTGMDTAIGERLRRVRPYLNGDDMFLSNYGDVLTDAPMNDLITQFAKTDAVAQLLAVKPQDSFHLVDIEGDSTVTGLTAVASMSMRINGGYFVFRKEIFDYLNEGDDLVMDGCIRAARAGRVRAVQYDGFWAPMDTLKERSALEEQYRRGNSPWALWRARPVNIRRPMMAVEEIDPIIR
jgi:glucose-1-phosphate cytidylyltransferase